ncbi:MAG: helix-turn-helix transcriptional regulator [Candidatus Kerfeldbacteria bacterium]|nr:helix-turn-helix transcriptional regulator [Candidatus Kerfeldbacteria bacterium]
MSKAKLISKAVDFDVYVSKRLKDAQFKKRYDTYGKQLEIAYQVLQLRKKQRMSQADLARKLGTTQSNVARLEAGEQNFTTQTLHRIAWALGRELKVEFVSR